MKWIQSFRDMQSMLLLFHNRNTASFPVYMDELPNFTPAFEGNFALTLISALYALFTEKSRGQGRSMEIVLAPGNYPEVLVQPRWWNVLMFMHMKGITHSNSRTTISLPHCVIINGLDYIQNAKTPLILNHILFQIILPIRMLAVVLSLVISFG